MKLGQRLLALLVTCLCMVVSATAMDVHVQIDRKIEPDKIELLRQRIPFFREVSADTVTYFELPGDVLFVRIEDRRYCNRDHCLTFIFGQSSISGQYLTVFAKNTAILTARITTLGDERNGDNGTIASFLVDSPESRINIFISEKLMVVVPLRP
jgi:hypothetical protein